MDNINTLCLNQICQYLSIDDQIALAKSNIYIYRKMNKLSLFKRIKQLSVEFSNKKLHMINSFRKNSIAFYIVCLMLILPFLFSIYNICYMSYQKLFIFLILSVIPIPSYNKTIKSFILLLFDFSIYNLVSNFFLFTCSHFLLNEVSPYNFEIRNQIKNVICNSIKFHKNDIAEYFLQKYPNKITKNYLQDITLKYDNLYVFNLLQLTPELLTLLINDAVNIYQFHRHQLPLPFAHYQFISSPKIYKSMIKVIT